MSPFRKPSASPPSGCFPRSPRWGPAPTPAARNGVAGARWPEARSAQRLQLSRDLHDFVAHDVSGIVVQAQAARFVATTDPSQAVLALERIEKAGLNALASMDQTVQMLHGPEAAPATDPLPGVSQLPSLI
ncbi:histidine kinase [Streptomyces albidoflavus]